VNRKSNRFAVVEQLAADGMQYVFGNAGDVDRGFVEAMSSQRGLCHVVTLQETVAVMMAEGYARTVRRPTAVHLHGPLGIGNVLGALDEALRGHSPLIVIGGDARARLGAHPVTKWSTTVSDPASLLQVLRRAIAIAATPPMGPVYVCVPREVMDAPAAQDVEPTQLPAARPDADADAEAVRAAAALPTRSRHLARLMDEAPSRLPDDAIMFEGIPGAIGVKLANPGKVVVGFASDADAMHTIQALWTAARHHVDVKLVICNSGAQRSSRFSIAYYRARAGLDQPDQPVSADLRGASIRFDERARSLGVDGVRVERPAEIAVAIERALARPGPFLIDLIVDAPVSHERVADSTEAPTPCLIS
jgi:thiamine pyrophosphate-dependent acetolactate synthase large subunit-like protein